MEGVDNYVLSCHSPTETPSCSDLGADGSIAWYFDNQTWRHSSIERDAIERIRAWGADGL